MAENGRFDPMVLESLLHYPHTLEKTPLVVRAEADVCEEDPCMESTEAGKLSRLHDPKLLLHLVLQLQTSLV
jgi:hypothetical protein